MRSGSVFRSSNASTSVRAVTVVVIVLGAIVTGSISLVLEDLLPKLNAEETIVYPRWILLASSVLLVAFAVWLRYEVRSYSGTLFSLQVRDEGMADGAGDGGTDPKVAADRRYMYLHSLHRWIDFEHAARWGVVDLHVLCHEVGTTLELLINTAWSEGTRTVAPNMPWPVAMAVGTYLPARQVEIRLLELPTQSRHREHEFALGVAADAHVDSGVSSVHHLPGAHGNRVGALLSLTEEPDRGDLDCLRPFGVDTAYAVTASREARPPDSSVPFAEPELESFGRTLAEELIEIKRAHAREELVVAAVLPVAVAMSAGWHLTQHTCRFYRNTYLLYFDGDKLVPMRARPSQPKSLDRKRTSR